MSEIQKTIYICVSALSLLCYFISEQALRTITIASMTRKMDTSAIVSKLPLVIREAVNHKIAVASAQSNLANATSDVARITALNRLAVLSESVEDKDKYYGVIFSKYGNMPESNMAYNYFFFEKGKKYNVTIDKYNEFIQKLNSIPQFWAWSSGLKKLESKNAKNSEIIKFLTPIVKITPKYRDFYSLYAKLSTYALKEGADSLHKKAEEKKRFCLKLKTIEKVARETEQKRRIANKRIKRDKIKSKGASK